MYAQPRSLGLIAIVLLAVVSLAGCGIRTTSRSTGGCKMGSREVKFSLDGKGGISQLEQDTAIISFTEGKVVVEKARVLLNEKEVAKVPEDAKVVEVDYDAGTLTITADGSKVHEAELRK